MAHLTSKTNFRILITIVGISILSIIYLNTRITAKANSSNTLVNHTEEVIRKVQELKLETANLVSRSQAFLISKDTFLLHEIIQSEAKLPVLKMELGHLVADNRNQDQWIDSLQHYIDNEKSLHLIVKVRKAGEEGDEAALVAEKITFNGSKIAAIGDRMIELERGLLVARKLAYSDSIFTIRIFLFSLIVACLFLCSAIIWMVRKEWTQQALLQKDLKRMANMVEESSEIFFSRGTDYRLTSWNKGAEHFFGIPKEEALGQMPQQLGFLSITPDEMQEVQKIIDKEGYWKSERTFYHRNGSSFIGSVTANMIRDKKGNPETYYFLIKNIDSQKKHEEQLVQSNLELEKRVAERTKDLVASENRFRSLLENGNDIISVMDKEFKIKYRSPTASRVTGWTDAEVLGKSRLESIHPDDREQIEEHLSAVLSDSSKPVSMVFRNLHKDGTFDWVEGVLMNMLDNEFVRGIVLNYRDINERKEAEDKLAASELRFRSLIENVAEGVALSDDQFNTIYRSPAAKQFIGDITRVNTTSVVHPDDVEMIRKRQQDCLKYPGIPIPFSGRFKHASGYYIWMEGTLTNLLHLKGVNAIVSNYRDITQRKEAEEKLVRSEQIYKTIASGIPGTVISLLDKDFRYFLIEGDMLERLGYSKREMLNKTVKEVFKGNDYGTLEEQFKRVFKGETVEYNSTRNGYDIYSKFVPLFNEKEEVFAMMIAATDVTEIKKAERQIKELNAGLEEKILQRTEQLKRANEEMDAFTYSVSHDLRAPLRGIIGFADILAEEYASKLDEEAKRLVGVVQKNAMSMGQLIDDLLAFSRIGKSTVSKAAIDMNLLVDEVIINLRRLHPEFEKVSCIVKNLEPINGDLSAIRQVWVNLISNAIKYSGKNPHPEIEIGSYKQGEQRIYYVKDNGVGFDERYKHKLFKVFQRLHRSDEFEGTGIGLALVDKIVARHGGTVWAESDLGKGACFSFRLPLEYDLM